MNFELEKNVRKHPRRKYIHVYIRNTKIKKIIIIITVIMKTLF